MGNHFDHNRGGSQVLQWLHDLNIQDKHYLDPAVEHADASTMDRPVYRLEEIEPDIYLGEEEEHAYHLQNPPSGWENKRVQQIAQDLVDKIQVKIFDQLDYKFGEHLD